MTSEELTLQRVADALHKHAKETGVGFCPASWEGGWREWYRSLARKVLEAARDRTGKEPVENPKSSEN